MPGILFRQYHILRSHFPVYVQFWIIPYHGPLALRSIKIVALVLEQCCLTQYTKTVRESSGNEKLTVIVSRQLDCHVSAECRRTAADIHGHVQDCSLHYPHQFALGKRQLLKMQPPQHSV